MASTSRQPKGFFPKVDASVLSPRHQLPQAHPQTVGPIYDPDNADKAIEPWPSEAESSYYPSNAEAYGAASVPDRPACLSDRYLRAFLAKNERIRLSMLWYYARDIMKEAEFLCGLQEKAQHAQESTGWEFVVIGILDVNKYTRLATIGLPLAVLPRGEIICAHTVTQPPESVFLLPDMMEDWRFRESPHVEFGGLRAYAGVPLRLQTESGDCVGLGSLCVASSTSQKPLTRSQQHTLARLADWVVSDIVHCARVRRQRERHRLSELVSAAQREMRDAASEEPVLNILRSTYVDAQISIQSSRTAYVEVEGRAPIPASDLEDGFWEDTEYLDDFIANSNHQDPPSTKVVRIIAAQCESMSGPSLLIVASKDFRFVFDDVDSWFLETCAGMLSQMWHKRLLAEVMRAKEKFLRGISHHLRTPIHGILSSVELLAEVLKSLGFPGATHPASKSMEEPAFPSNPVVYIDTIKYSGRDLVSIINSMITLNRWTDIATADRDHAMHTVGELETQLANEVLQTTSGDTRYMASLMFVDKLPTTCDGFRTDLNLLRESLLPVVINAIQNTPEGVVVVTVSVNADRRKLVVDIEDTGRGIHPDHQKRIFEPFEQVSQDSTGTGLGLTIASKFASLLCGSITLLSSHTGRGSHFRASFSEVECAHSPIPSHPLAAKLKPDLPSKFYRMTTVSSGASLCDYFARFLTCEGFSPSDSLEDSLAIIDFVPGQELHAYLAQVPTSQVIICLIPASGGEVLCGEAFDNVIYLRGPFLTSTMRSAVEKAAQFISKIRRSRASPCSGENSCTLALLKKDGNLGTSYVPAVTAHTSHPETDPAQLPRGGLVDGSLDSSAHLSYQPNPTALNTKTAIPMSIGLVEPVRPTALLVDDNIVNLRILQMYCSKRGFPYRCATNGVEAAEVFMRHQLLAAAGGVAAIQLILMDLQMPVCDGIEATRRIRAIEEQNMWRKTLLYMVTGQDSLADRTAAESAGADGYFVKPVSIHMLDCNLKQHFPAAFTSS